MADINALFCCGMAELHGVQHYTSKQFHNILAAVKVSSKGAFLFSSAVECDPGDKALKSNGATRLAKALIAKELGEVTAIPPFRNPNTGNMIVSFMWGVNRNALNAYCVKNKITGDIFRPI